eukprot:TRINITY_DN28579_c0_g1_i1.p1 TRINITY_DN28579_c0_g1~~TRINITY_DN28579_c0_g1_i1.p1  ORF type:complete len:299 (-),score=50.15 TRINITY_DN28579_c0_g1_i1:115-1011(-)
MPFTSYNASISEKNTNVAAKLQAEKDRKKALESRSDLAKSSDNNANKVGSYTSRGTKITDPSDNGMGKDAFLKLLAAQMTNMDPTQDQDSTAYVAQMAQFASIEQMTNLNDTMSNYSVRNLLGKTVIVDKYDDKGNPIQGTVQGVQRKNGKNLIAISTDNGKIYDNLEVNKITSVIQNTTDTSSTFSAFNTQFMAASALNNQRVIMAHTDDKGEVNIIRGQVKGVYIDGATVKLRINPYDDNLNLTDEEKIYSYLDLYQGGDLTDEDMKVSDDDIKQKLGVINEELEESEVQPTEMFL